MSNLLPDRRALRLPGSSRTPDSSKNRATPSQIEQTTCGICGKQKSRYVCPQCNVFYCSLDCFRSEIHSQCSEPFYRSVIQSEIASDPNADPEEKRKMMELLKRFEAGQDSSEDLNAGNSIESSDPRLMEQLVSGVGPAGANVRHAEEHGADIASEEEAELDALRDQLAGVDLDNLPPDELLALLPPGRRAQFLALLDQPDSEGVKELLEEVERQTSEVKGWWRYCDADLGAENEDGDDGQSVDRKEADVGSLQEGRLIDGASVASDEDKAKQTNRPSPIPDSVLAGISVQNAVATKLIYNVFAVCLSYLHLLPYHMLLPSLSHTMATRQLDGPTSSSPTSQSHTLQSSSTGEFWAFRLNLAKAVPFLEDPKSTVRLGSVETVLGLAGGYLFNQDTVASLAGLKEIMPLIAQPVDLAQPHSFSLILADLYSMYTSRALYTPGRAKSPAFANHAARKIAFYAVAIGRLNRAVWTALLKEIAAVAEEWETVTTGSGDTVSSHPAASHAENFPPTIPERASKIEIIP